jgi:hypothetical protein
MGTGKESDSDNRRREYEFVFNESVRGLTLQQQRLDNLRARAGVLLSGASVAVSFLGSRALSENPGNFWAEVGILLFALAGLACIVIIWPHREWTFSNSANDIIDSYIESDPPETLETLHRDLALFAEQDFDDNERRMTFLFIVFRAACLFLVADIMLWLSVLRG